MKLVTILASLLVFTSGHAKSYDLKIDISLAGKKIGSPRVIVKENERASFVTEDNNQKTTIEIIAKDATTKEIPNGIKLDFRINHIELASNRTIEISPALLVKENSPASIITNTDSGEEISLSITSKSINLTN